VSSTKTLPSNVVQATISPEVSMAAKNVKEPRPTRSFTARLAADALDTLQQLANEDDRSLAYVVQKAIDAYAEEHGGRRKGK
jgi:hypothetical protein